MPAQGGAGPLTVLPWLGRGPSPSAPSHWDDDVDERRSEANARLVVVLSGGPDLPSTLEVTLRARLGDAHAVVCADSGLHLASQLGLVPTHVVGDLDSVALEHLEAARAVGAVVQAHPVDKDATDFELALDAARLLGATHIEVVAGAGGRLDHLVATLAVLAAPFLASLQVVAHIGEARCTVVRREAELTGRAGDLVTLLPMGGSAHGVTTTGLRFALRGEDLAPTSSRGVSNEFVDTTARVHLDGGVLLAIQPRAATSGGGPLVTPSPEE